MNWALAPGVRLWRLLLAGVLLFSGLCCVVVANYYQHAALKDLHRKRPKLAHKVYGWWPLGVDWELVHKINEAEFRQAKSMRKSILWGSIGMIAFAGGAFWMVWALR